MGVGGRISKRWVVQALKSRNHYRHPEITIWLVSHNPKIAGLTNLKAKAFTRQRLYIIQCIYKLLLHYPANEPKCLEETSKWQVTTSDVSERWIKTPECLVSRSWNFTSHFEHFFLLLLILSKTDFQWNTEERPRFLPQQSGTDEGSMSRKQQRLYEVSAYQYVFVKDVSRQCIISGQLTGSTHHGKYEIITSHK